MIYNMCMHIIIFIFLHNQIYSVYVQYDTIVLHLNEWRTRAHDTSVRQCCRWVIAGARLPAAGDSVGDPPRRAGVPP